MSEAANDQITQATCEAIVSAIAVAVESEIPSRVVSMRLPDGGIVGKQLVIDATEPGGRANMCRIGLLNPDIAPEGEAVRIEFEHDRQTKFGVQRVYSIQSLRRQAGRLVLMENFLAQEPKDVREEDFRPITSEVYAKTTVLKTVQDYARYRAWQLQEARQR